MISRPLHLALFAATLSLPAVAGQLVCPDLADAVQVNACPTDEELKFTYSGFCSDDAKAYAKETDSCIRFDDFRRMKNLARWESKDGVFDGYVSCDLPVDGFRALKLTGMKVVEQGKLSKLVCSYANGVSFTYRTKSACKVLDDQACATDAANCQATCD